MKLSVELLKVSDYERKDGTKGANLLCYLAWLGEAYSIFTTTDTKDILVNHLRNLNSTDISDYVTLKYSREDKRLYLAIDVNKIQ